MNSLDASPICVIVNPRAGRKRARRRLQRMLEQLRGQCIVWPTEFPGHGSELARRAVQDGCSIIAAAGGDGTVHDVAQGLLASDRLDVTLAVIPVGSANDFAWSVQRQFGVADLGDDHAAAVDIGVVRSSTGRERHFCESLGLGLSGQVTLEARRLGFLQGLLLYGLAAWRALRRARPTPLELGWDDGPEEQSNTLLLSLMLGRREGSFLLAPDASLNDGLMDFVHAGPIGRWEAVRMLPALAWSGPPRQHPRIRLGRCRRLQVRSASPLTVHIDGEMFAVPEDGVHGLEVSLLPSRLRVKVCLPW